MVITKIGEVARQHGFTSAMQFQKATGFSYPTASDLYADRVQRIGLDIIDKVCEVLGVEPGDIIKKVLDGQQSQPQPHEE